MIRLLSHDKCPPGEFYYVQTVGLNKSFASSPLIGKLAARVANFRSANGLPRPGKEEALQDIDAFTCARLNNDPRFCYDTEKPVTLTAHESGGCKTCGAKVA